MSQTVSPEYCFPQTLLLQAINSLIKTETGNKLVSYLLQRQKQQQKKKKVEVLDFWNLSLEQLKEILSALNNKKENEEMQNEKEEKQNVDDEEEAEKIFEAKTILVENEKWHLLFQEIDFGCWYSSGEEEEQEEKNNNDDGNDTNNNIININIIIDALFSSSTSSSKARNSPEISYRFLSHPQNKEALPKILFETLSPTLNTFQIWCNLVQNFFEQFLFNNNNNQKIKNEFLVNQSNLVLDAFVRNASVCFSSSSSAGNSSSSSSSSIRQLSSVSTLNKTSYSFFEAISSFLNGNIKTRTETENSALREEGEEEEEENSNIKNHHHSKTKNKRKSNHNKKSKTSSSSTTTTISQKDHPRKLFASSQESFLPCLCLVAKTCGNALHIESFCQLVTNLQLCQIEHYETFSSSSASASASASATAKKSPPPPLQELISVLLSLVLVEEAIVDDEAVAFWIESIFSIIHNTHNNNENRILCGETRIIVMDEENNNQPEQKHIGDAFIKISEFITKIETGVKYFSTISTLCETVYFSSSKNNNNNNYKQNKNFLLFSSPSSTTTTASFAETFLRIVDNVEENNNINDDGGDENSSSVLFITFIENFCSAISRIASTSLYNQRMFFETTVSSSSHNKNKFEETLVKFGNILVRGGGEEEERVTSCREYCRTIYTLVKNGENKKILGKNKNLIDVLLEMMFSPLNQNSSSSSSCCVLSKEKHVTYFWICAMELLTLMEECFSCVFVGNTDNKKRATKLKKVLENLKQQMIEEENENENGVNLQMVSRMLNKL